MGVETSFDLVKLNASVVRWVTEDTHQGCFVTDVQLRVVLWNRYDLAGVFGVAPDGSVEPEPM